MVWCGQEPKKNVESAITIQKEKVGEIKIGLDEEAVFMGHLEEMMKFWHTTQGKERAAIADRRNTLNMEEW